MAKSVDILIQSLIICMVFDWPLKGAACSFRTWYNAPMKIVPFFILGVIAGLFLFSGSAALAQAKSDPSQLLLDTPMIDPANADGSHCFTILNKAPYSVTGSINTDYYETAAGTKARANSNFRLAPGAQQRLCSYGPFYPGERLELVIRSLIPLFSCFTVAQGDIVIYGQIKPEGGTKTWAECQ